MNPALVALLSISDIYTQQLKIVNYIYNIM